MIVGKRFQTISSKIPVQWEKRNKTKCETDNCLLFSYKTKTINFRYRSESVKLNEHTLKNLIEICEFCHFLP